MISSRAWPAAVFDGAMAMPLEPPGSLKRAASSACGESSGGLEPPRGLGAVVEGLQFGQGRALDVAADAALGEAQRHPGLESGDDAGLHLGMVGQVGVQPVGPGVHQRAEPRRTGGVVGPEHGGIDEQLLPQVRPDGALALGFGQTAKRVQVVGLHPVEVVLGLRVDHAEDRVSVGAAVHVGDAPVVPDDGEPRRFGAPAGKLDRIGGPRRVRAKSGGHRQHHQNPHVQPPLQPRLCGRSLAGVRPLA